MVRPRGVDGHYTPVNGSALAGSGGTDRNYGKSRPGLHEHVWQAGMRVTMSTSPTRVRCSRRQRGGMDRTTPIEPEAVIVRHTATTSWPIEQPVDESLGRREGVTRLTWPVGRLAGGFNRAV